MRVSNTSRMDGALVGVVARWAAGLMEVRGWVREVLVIHLGVGPFRGRCHSRGRVRAWVGPPPAFPYTQSEYRAGSPNYEVRDPAEALAAILGHEFGHARQYMVKVRRHSEVECERQALWLLTQFRERRAELERVAEGLRSSMEARAREEGEKEAARAALAPAREMAALEAKVKEWAAREKRARTWRLKYEQRLTRVRKSLEGGWTP